MSIEMDVSIQYITSFEVQEKRLRGVRRMWQFLRFVSVLVHYVNSLTEEL